MSHYRDLNAIAAERIAAKPPAPPAPKAVEAPLLFVKGELVRDTPRNRRRLNRECSKLTPETKQIIREQNELAKKFVRWMVHNHVPYDAGCNGWIVGSVVEEMPGHTSRYSVESPFYSVEFPVFLNRYGHLKRKTKGNRTIIARDHTPTIERMQERVIRAIEDSGGTLTW